MNTHVLKTLLDNKDSDYFVVEKKETYRDNDIEHHLILIALPHDIKNIIREKTIDTITFKEVEIIKNSYIITNYYIKPKYPPFQINISPFYNVTNIIPINLNGVLNKENHFNIYELILNIISRNFQYAYEVEKYIEEYKK